MTSALSGTTDDIELRIRDGVAWITLSRPDKRNAMTIAMWRRLGAICRALAADPAVVVAVVAGRGASFCSGADISNLREDDATLRRAVDEAQAALRGLNIPTIARIHGHCWGGGLEIAVNCDIRITARDASFAVPPAKLGVVYPVHSIEALVWLIGPAATKRLVFTARPVDAHEALRLGLVDVVADGDGEHQDGLDRAVLEEVGLMVGRSLLSQAAAKAIVNTICDLGDQTAEYRRWRRIWADSPDALEGPSAFLEKRPARFTWHPAHDSPTS